MDRDVPDFPADPDLLKRAIMNLVQNALKHTHDGGSIVLGAEKRNGFARLSVSDTGAGIPLEDQAGLFGKFRRLEAMSADGRPGTGLGLYFCRLVAEAHGGRAELKSEPGKGTTVTLFIPLHDTPNRRPRTGRVEMGEISRSVAAYLRTRRPEPRVPAGRN